METIKWSALTPVQRNELIAERVMGAQRVPCPDQGQHYNLTLNVVQNYWRCGTCGARSQGGNDMQFEHVQVFDCPKYSESLDDAWKIVEGGIFLEVFIHSLEVRSDGRSQRRYVCNVDHKGLYVGATGQTAPHALCIAALRAIGLEVQDDK